MKTIQVQPEQIHLGSLLAAHGFVMRVEQISIWCYTVEQYEQHKAAASVGVEVFDWSAYHDPANLSLGDDIATFGVKGSFVSGNRKMFDYFRQYISSGPDCGKRSELAYQQGNARAGWYIAQDDEIAA